MRPAAWCLVFVLLLVAAPVAAAVFVEFTLLYALWRGL